ncbi:hypothetical protein AOCH_002523 [Aspergillus ochraceoroseus]|uniref:NADP-dependent oxidoreductase domain-containing protein n=1 Tax=Aspergillus ochraceoroseus TaxID=138278 RepID=A0A0F8UK31_9EURO|nr:hypothetical protein AOCH_002523 [Aspergillus ochraceoroseus]
MSNNERLKIVFGSMTFGKPNTLGSRVYSVDEAAKILDVFQSHGFKEVDTARIYGDGSCEEMLAELDWQKRGLIMDTKLYPSAKTQGLTNPDLYTHQAEDIRRGLLTSIKALQSDNIDLFYLHAPDRSTPFEETLREVNKLHGEGYFRRFGLSNFMAWEVAQICEICKSHGWIMPTVYQGVYHGLQRGVEAELLSCLRKFGISLYAFQPLAGGLLAGRYKRNQTEFEPGSRFDPNILQGAVHQKRYWNDVYFDALENIHAVADKHGLTDAEVALRWLKHNSELNAQLGDAILVGASSVKHLEGNLADLEKGPLPEEIVAVFDEAWASVKGIAAPYWH